MGKILHADSRSRTWAVRAVAIGTLIGSVGISLLAARMRHFAQLAPDSPAAGLVLARLYELLIGGSVLATCLIAYFVLRRSLLALRHGEFPPPGTRVLRDTPIVTGNTARWASCLGIVLGVLLVGCAAVLLALGARLEACLGHFSGT